MFQDAPINLQSSTRPVLLSLHQKRLQHLIPRMCHQLPEHAMFDAHRPFLHDKTRHFFDNALEQIDFWLTGQEFELAEKSREHVSMEIDEKCRQLHFVRVVSLVMANFN